MRIDEIRDALHPLAASLEAQVDKEQVTLTGTFPRDGWERFADVALPQLTDPGFREEDFRRVKDDAAERARPGSARDERRGLAKRAAPGERLRGHAVRPSRARHHRGATRGDARRREGVRRIALHARERRPRARGGATRLRRSGQRLWLSRSSPPASARADADLRATPEGARGGDRGEGHARRGDLVRPPHRRGARRSRLRRALAREDLARRAPLLELPPVPAHPTGARDELRRLRLRRGVPARHVPVLPRSERRAPRAALRDLDPPGRARECPHGDPIALHELRRLVEDGLTQDEPRRRASTS